jgi:ribose transport system ATP-binding protein
MVGRAFTSRFPQRPPRQHAPDVLVVRDLVISGSPWPVSFEARSGEVVGFAGLVGAGRTELMQVIFGASPSLGGTMLLEGQPYRPRGTRDAIRRGVFLAPEDRKRHGLVLPMSVAQNLSLPAICDYRPRFWLQRGMETAVAEEQVDALRIKTPDIHRKVVNLSGGNQQKVVLGKWLAMQPKVLILDEPTRGIDVGAKAEIYRQMAALADSGICILMVSSEMEEVIGMSDRVVVMHERRIKGILPRAAVSEASIGALMTGRDQAA